MFRRLKAVSLVTLITIMVSCLSLSTYAITQYPTGNYAIQCQGTNFRLGAGLKYSVVCVLSKGAIVNITNIITDSSGKVWGNGSYNGTTGYLRLDGGFASYTGTQPNATTNYPTGSYSVLCQGTNFRSGAGLSYSVVCVLNKGTIVNIANIITDSSGKVWGNGSYNGTTGYIRLDGGFASYIQPTPDSAPSSSLMINPKQQHTIASAKSLRQALNSQGGATSFVQSQLTVATNCYKAMNMCRVQTSWNNVTVDITAACVKATVFVGTTVASAPTVYEVISSSIKDAAISVTKDQLLSTLDILSPEASVYSMANNAMTDINYHILYFVKLHTSSDLNTYEDAAKYIALYEAIRMDQRTIKFGLDYFTSNLKSSASITNLLKACVDSFVPDNLSSTGDIISYANYIDSVASKMSIPCFASYYNDMINLQKEQMQFLAIK